jgi:PAS domain S-box-containing protein
MISAENNKRDGKTIKGEVLIVDDKPDNLRLLSGILKKNGYKVRPVLNGELALTSIRSTTPDLILLDIMMPEMDGYEVCRRLKEDKETRDIPVVFTSALSGLVDLIKGFNVGGVDYITKPFQQEEILARVNTHVSLFRMQKKLEQLVNERTIELTRTNEQLRREIKERILAEAREKHLNLLLRIVRNINQLIVKEKDPFRLLNKSCEILIEYPLYSHAWIILTDATGKLVATAKAGIGKEFSEMINQIEHEGLPVCIQAALKQPNILLIKNTSLTCGNCPISVLDQNRGAVCVRLEHAEHIFGFLNISFPIESEMNEEEQSLLIELSGDISYALYGFEQEKRKAQIEKSLRKSEQKYRELADSLPQVVFEMNAEWILTFVNHNAYKVFGYTQSEFNEGLYALEMIIPEDRERAMKNIEQVFNGENTDGSEYTALKKDGKTFPAMLHVALIYQDKKPIGLRGIMIDLTRRKQEESELVKLSTAVQQSPSLIAITDLKGNLEYVNPKFTELTGYSRKEAIGQNPRILKSGKHPDEMYKKLWETISSGKEWHGDFNNKKKNADLYWEGASISPIFDKQGKVISYIKVSEDITERKQAEEQIQRNLEEKEILLKEIHHRVMNNLQIMSGLLRMQSTEVEDKHFFEIFDKSLSRIESMSIVHRMMYQSHNFARIEMSYYIMNLISSLTSHYSLDTKRIAITTRCKDVQLDLNRAIPCGLILNELISNAIIHAFPDKRKGEIEVQLEKKSGNIILSVRDDGTALPPDYESADAKTVGMTLVLNLTEQLGGNFEIIPTDTGKVFKVIFNIDVSKNYIISS